MISSLWITLLWGSGAYAGSSCLPVGQTPEPTTPIKNIVITVLENRSFDNLFGYANYTNDIDGISSDRCNAMDPKNPDSKMFCAKKEAWVQSEFEVMIMLNSKANFGPHHSLIDISWQIFGEKIDITQPSASLPEPNMKGFIQEHAIQGGWNDDILQQLINAYDPDKIPILSKLAQEFVLFDRWFCSAPSWTAPNRDFIHSNTANGMPGSGDFSAKDAYIKGFPQKTMWDALSEKGISWSNYFPEQNSVNDCVQKSSQAQAFFKDAKEGKLPAVSFIDMIYKVAPWGSDALNDGSAPGDMSRTELNLKQTYEALRSSPQWDNMLWIITFDEHGGFADHVPPPKGVPRPDDIPGKDGFLYDRLGVRVPTLLVSPWIPKGKVVHGQDAVKPMSTSEYEHSSIASTVFKLLGLGDMYLTERSKWASTFEHLFQGVDKPRVDCPMLMPEIYQESSPTANRNAEQVSEFENMVRQAYIFGLESEKTEINSTEPVGVAPAFGNGTKWNGEPTFYAFQTFKNEVLKKMSSRQLRKFMGSNM